MSTRRIVVALVRHGDYHQPDRVPSAQLPHPLTAKGVEQARALGPALLAEARALGLAIHPVLDCSNLLRARQTADLAAAGLTELVADATFTVAEFAELQERSLGAAANLDVDAIAAALRADPRLPELPADWKGHPRFRLPIAGAESLMMAGARVAAHIERRAHELRLAHGPDTLAVFVTHGGAARHAAVCMGALELLEVSALSMHHCGHVLLEHVPDPRGRTHGPGRWHKIGGRWKQRSSATD